MSGGESKVSELLGQTFTPTIENRGHHLTLKSQTKPAERELRVITPVLSSVQRDSSPQANVAVTVSSTASPVLQANRPTLGPLAKNTEAFQYTNANTLEDMKNG